MRILKYYIKTLASEMKSWLCCMFSGVVLGSKIVKIPKIGHFIWIEIDLYHYSKMLWLLLVVDNVNKVLINDIQKSLH